MIQFATARPPPHLRDHVLLVWRMTGQGGFQDLIFPDVGGAEVVIQRGDVGRIERGGVLVAQPVRAVTGGMSRALLVEHPARVDVIGLQLAPGCACLLGERAGSLRELVAPLGEVAPRLDRALEAWAEARLDTDALWRLVERHLAPRCDAAATRAARALAEGNTTVAELADAIGLSRRQLLRRFEPTVGLPPRQFARVARLARAWRLAMAGPPQSWAGIALAAGYTDQSHLVREFHALVGEAPTRVFSPEWYASVS